MRLQVESRSINAKGNNPQKFSSQVNGQETSSIIHQNIRVQLKWENITVIPKDQAKDASVTPKKILDNVCGTVMPRQFLAIIGASGKYSSDS